MANAGAGQSVVVGTLITLNGSASSDANGDVLTFAWTLTSRPAGSSSTLVGANTIAPSFIADVAGSYIASLVVNDGLVNSTPATVTITASTANAPPVANAGTAQSVIVGTLVTLNGSDSSDANGDLLTYSWTLTSKPIGSTATLSGVNTAAPTFTADLAGMYIARLVVNDGVLDSFSDTVTITAAVQNAAPVANAGPAQNVIAGRLVALDGTGSSDANGDLLTYSWTLTSKPSGSTAVLGGANTVAPLFTADLAGTYVITLVVNDGQLSSAPSTVTITAAVQNVAPVANAGPNQNVIAGSLVTLNGSGSSDANGDLLTYSWTLTSKPIGSTATLSGANTAAPTFTADLAGTYVITLVVNDGQLSSAPSTVTITAVDSFIGSWAGTTGQGRAISFVVNSAGIPSLTLSFSAPSCGVTGTSTTTFGQTIPIVGAAFNDSTTSGFLRAFSGSFSSSSQASGTITFRYEDFVFSCFQTITTTWTATKQ